MWSINQRNQLKTILQHHWPHHRSASSHCLDDDLQQNRIHLPGGNLQTIHGRHIGRITKRTEDPLGRWVAQALDLKNDKRLMIINRL